MTFRQWHARLRKALGHEWRRAYRVPTSKWHELYDAGYTPEEAADLSRAWHTRNNPVAAAGRVLGHYNATAEDPIRICIGGSDVAGYSVEVSTEWGVVSFYDGATLDEALRQFVEEYG